MSSNFTIYNPEDIIKKEARGLGEDTDFGELQEVGVEYIVTQKKVFWTKTDTIFQRIW